MHLIKILTVLNTIFMTATFYGSDFISQPKEIQTQILLFTLSGKNEEALKTAALLPKVSKKFEELCKEESIAERINDIKAVFIFEKIKEPNKENAHHILNCLKSSSVDHNQKDTLITKCYNQLETKPPFVTLLYDMGSCLCTPCDFTKAVCNFGFSCNSVQDKQQAYCIVIREKYGLLSIDEKKLFKTKNYKNYEEKRKEAQCCFACTILRCWCCFFVDDRIAQSIANRG